MRNLYIFRLMGNDLDEKSIMEWFFRSRGPILVLKNWKICYEHTIKQWTKEKKRNNDNRHAVSAIYVVCTVGNSGGDSLLIHS